MNNKITSFIAAGVLGSLVGSIAHAAAGRTLGQFDVSSIGAAGYTIPIYAPPGPNGLQPSVALTYNSNSGIGTVGKGWGLSGISAISRCSRTFAQDGIPSSAALEVNDALCMDGKRLRLTSGAYGTAGSTYQTEVADFSLVTALGAQGTGPASFSVRTKNGLILEYGNTGDSRVAATGTSTASLWMLNKVSDRAGNRIFYTYKSPDGGTTGTTHPVKIEWTATTAGASTFLYSMDFAYGNNAPASTETAYVGGTLVTDDDILTSVSVSQSGTVKKKYFLAYETSPTTSALRLQAVTECSDAAGSDCLSPSLVGYQNGQAGVATTPTPVLSDAAQLFSKFDLNGDGRKDLVYLTAGVWYVTFSSAGGFGAPVTIGTAASLGGVLLGDIRGNGQDGILVVQSSSVTYYYWNGSGFAQSSTGISLGGTYFRGILDVNGDGKPDLVSIDVPTTTIYYNLNVSSSSSVSFAAPVAAISMNESGAGIHVDDSVSGLNGRQLDFNGDGRADFVIKSTSTFTWIEPFGNEITGYIYRTYMIASTPDGGYGAELISEQVDYFGGGGNFAQPIFMDINDDNCTDYSWIGGGGGAVTVSGCGGPGGGSASFPAGARAILDWNGDGRSDVLSFENGGMYIYISTATGLLPGVLTGLPADDALWTATDINGDGLDDLVRRTGANSPMAVSFFLHNASGIQPDLATSFTDGYGVTQAVTYTPTAWSNYTKQTGSTYPHVDIQPRLYVVKDVSLSDGIGGTATKSYWYYGASTNLQGRGFGGFSTRRVLDSRTSVAVLEYSMREFPFVGMPYKTESYQSNGGPLISLSSTNYTWRMLDSTPGSERRMVYPDSQSSSSFEVGGAQNTLMISQTSASFTFDNFGNATSQTRTVADRDITSPLLNHTWTTTTSLSITPDNGANWCLGLPTASTETYSTSTGEPTVVRSKSFTPDYANCRISQQVVEPASANRRVEQTLGYDSFGNVSTVTVVGREFNGAAMASRLTQVGYGTTGQFPETSINALNQSTTRTYHPFFGGLASEIDPNGVTVSGVQYDSFGRTTRRTRADGTSTTFEYALCSAYGCQNGDPASGATGIDKILVVEREKDTSDNLVRDTWTHFDVFDRPIVINSRTLSGGFNRVGRQYDALGRVWRETAPCDQASCSAYWTTFGYDLVGRQTTQTRPQSQSVSTPITLITAYAGRTQTATDPQSKVTTRILDVNGNVRRSQDHNGYYQSFTYDAFGTLRGVSDSLGNTLQSNSVSYGAGAIIDSLTDMDLGARTFFTNSLGERTGGSDAKGQSFSQVYDALSRPTSRSETEGVTTWTWGVSAASKNIGRLASVSGPGASESYTFDGIGRPQSRQINTDQAYAIDYSYNAAQGYLETLTYPTSTAGVRVKLQYINQWGHLQQVKDYNSSAVYWMANATSSRGQTTQETLGNGVVTNRFFDAVTGWMSTAQSGVGGGASLQNESYLRDLVGNVTQRQNSNLGLTENFFYDNLYRLDYSTLTSGSGSGVNLDVSYDAMGNITSRSDIAGGAAWAYHPTKKHAVTQAGSAAYTYGYDANGNVNNRFGYAVSWSSYDYPTGINGPGKSLTFYYDSNRNRYKQVYASSSGTETTNYVGGILEKVVNGGGTDWRHYIRVGSQTIAIVSRHSNGTNTTRYMLEDHQGSPSRILESNGADYVSESFTAFGMRRDPATWSDSCMCEDLSKIKSVSRMGYSGQEAIGGVSMGLNHMNGRVQDAIVGRFLSPDPFVFEPFMTQGFNRYSYVNNNPLSFVDPSGFYECSGLNDSDLGRGWSGDCWRPPAMSFGDFMYVMANSGGGASGVSGEDWLTAIMGTVPNFVEQDPQPADPKEQPSKSESLKPQSQSSVDCPPAQTFSEAVASRKAELARGALTSRGGNSRMNDVATGILVGGTGGFSAGASVGGYRAVAFEMRHVKDLAPMMRPMAMADAAAGGMFAGGSLGAVPGMIAGGLIGYAVEPWLDLVGRIADGGPDIIQRIESGPWRNCPRPTMVHAPL